MMSFAIAVVVDYCTSVMIVDEQNFICADLSESTVEPSRCDTYLLCREGARGVNVGCVQCGWRKCSAAFRYRSKNNCVGGIF